MWEKDGCNCNFVSYEEDYEGFDIYIEPNPDPYRGGYIWSVGKDCEQLVSELDFDLDICLANAKKFADQQI